jgi:hypothetical protein
MNPAPSLHSNGFKMNNYYMLENQVHKLETEKGLNKVEGAG